MRIFLIAIALAACAVSLSGCGGSHVSQTVNTDYYPMTVGSTWTYITKSADGTEDYGETLVRVASSRRVSKHWTYGMATYCEGQGGGSPYWSVHYTGSDSFGVARWGRQLLYDPIGTGGTGFVAYQEGRVVLQRPFEVGTVWYFRKSDDPSDLWRREVVSTTATVTTPAGTFDDCLQIQESPPLDGLPGSTLWYAPGVGLVREESINGSLPPGTPGAHKIKGLVSYHIGK